MNKLLVQHFEKIILGFVGLICLLIIGKYLNVFLDKEGDREEIDNLNAAITAYIENETDPPLKPLPNYVEVLNDKLEGEYVILMKDLEGRLFYNRGLKAKIPVIEKPRFELLPPSTKGDGIVVEGGYNLVSLSFSTDDSVYGIVTNRKESRGSENPFAGQKGEVVSALIQRKLVNNGKDDVQDAPWLTLSGSAETPEWAELENPLETTYLINGKKTEAPRIERPQPDAMGGFGRAGYSEGTEKVLAFSFEDLKAEEFRTYVYRIAIVGAVQEGVRVFRHASTDAELMKDQAAIRNLEQENYAKGEKFTGNKTIGSDQLKQLGVEPPTGGFGMPGGNDPAKAPFYLVASDWSAEQKATVKTDSKVFLSAVVGKSVSFFIEKNYRYIYDDNGVSTVAWTRLTVSFLHEINDRIGYQKNLQTARGNEFLDGKPRKVDYTTPYVLVEIGMGDRVKKIKRFEFMENAEGRLERQEVVKDRVLKDENFVIIKNLVTGELIKVWQDPDAIKHIKAEINKARAEALRRMREAAREREESSTTRRPRDEDDDEEEKAPPQDENNLPGENSRSDEYTKEMQKRMNQ